MPPGWVGDQKGTEEEYNVDLQYLIVDATRFKVYKNGETGLIKFGYSAQKQKNLPQVRRYVFDGLSGQKLGKGQVQRCLYAG